MPHIHEKIDFTAEVFIVYENTVLLRMHDKYHMWLGVGGHIEPDEDPNQAAIREVKEEVGLDVTLADDRLFRRDAPDYRELIRPRFLNRHRVTDTHEHITFTYFARATTNHVIMPDTHEKSDACRWVTREDLEKNEHNIPEAIRRYALAALEEYSQMGKT
ncbi:MAG: NUDIX domain-containing protein [Patescibacteria group bacterium]